MSRTQKKCFVAAAGTHLLLIVILFVGPAFLSSPDKAHDMPVLEFIPMLTTDKLVSGGGNPNANPPAPAPQPPVQQPQPQVTPPAPKPQPQVEKVQKPEPVKEIKTAKPDPDSLETKPDKARKPQVSTTVVIRSQVEKANQKPVTPKPDPQSSQSTSKVFTEAARRIRENASSSTTVEMPGVGGGGTPYANYAQVVRSAYMQAWIEPTGVDDDQATATVSVTISRTGEVISARIIQTSGNAAVDRAVQSTLDRVKVIAPFPEGAKETERTYKINFNLKANQLPG